MKPDFLMVFDVESIGLHGEGFAVGYVIVDRKGCEIESGAFACDAGYADGSDSDRAWVSKNIGQPKITNRSPSGVRDSFWRKWIEWKSKGAWLAADCSWPVEANFLSACIEDSPDLRGWSGPYPLLDVGSVLLAFDADPLGKFPRLESELPEHDPLCDARQSARLLMRCLSCPF